jgi:hypothetical protein
VLRTLSPLKFTHIAINKLPSDLHVLSTPPAFVLSQNQTLRNKSTRPLLIQPIPRMSLPQIASGRPVGANRTDLTTYYYSKFAPACAETNVGSHVSHISIFKELHSKLLRGSHRPYGTTKNLTQRQHIHAVPGKIAELLKNCPNPLAPAILYSHSVLVKRPKENIRNTRVSPFM